VKSKRIVANFVEVVLFARPGRSFFIQLGHARELPLARNLASGRIHEPIWQR
jgi:hypothetical protein